MTSLKENEIPEFLKYKYRHDGESSSDYKIELPKEKIFSDVVSIMRGNPPHVNHTAMLRELCEKAVRVKIDLGSSNKFDKKNPFKIEEREDMMNLALKGYNNYKLFRLPDFGNDEQWFNELCKINGKFTEILSNNAYDLNIYTAHQYEPGHKNEDRFRKYDIIHPTDVIDQNKMVYVKGILQDGAIFKQAKKPLYVSGTFVRAAIVNDWNWENFVDAGVVEYIKRKSLSKRIKEFCPELEGITLEKLDDGR